MPMKVEDVKKYEGYEEDEVKVASFLNKNMGNAFLQDEIMKGIGVTPIVYAKDEKGSYWTWENTGKFALEVANRVLFGRTLDEMVKKRKINVREVAGRKYYFVEEARLHVGFPKT
jgi:hypothetical protein